MAPTRVQVRLCQAPAGAQQCSYCGSHLAAYQVRDVAHAAPASAGYTSPGGVRCWRQQPRHQHCLTRLLYGKDICFLLTCILSCLPKLYIMSARDYSANTVRGVSMQLQDLSDCKQYLQNANCEYRPCSNYF